MDNQRYQELRTYCIQALGENMRLPGYEDVMQFAIKNAGGTIGRIYREEELARHLFQCHDLTSHERAAAHLLAVITNHRIVTWEREPVPPAGYEHSLPLEKSESEALAKTTRDAVKRFAAFLPAQERDVLLDDCEAAPADTPTGKDEAGAGTSQNGSTSGTIADFKAMRLTADKLTVAFVGDKSGSEYGLAQNNHLTISVDSEDKKEFRFSFTDLELLDLQSRELNSQGRMLLDFVWGRRTTNGKTISRLRAIFRKHLGVTSDPFAPKAAKWKPYFKIEDKRGAADERAKRDAMKYRTGSYGQGIERGEKADDASDYPYDAEGDSADEWISNSSRP